MTAGPAMAVEGVPGRRADVLRRRVASWQGALAGILAIALLARLAVIIATPHYRPIFDAADYDRYAVSIANGDGFPGSLLAPGPTAFRPPLYPLVLAPVHVIGGGWTAERVLGALLGVLAVALVFLVAVRLWDRRVALVATAITAVFPPLVIESATLLSEVLFVPLVLGTVLAVLEYRASHRARWAVAAGVLCGLGALTRSNGLLLVLAALLGVWTVRPRLSRAALVAPVAVIVFAALTVAPWVVRDAVVFHRWVGLGTQSGYGLAGTYNPDSRRIAQHPGRPRQAQQLPVFRDVFRRRDLDEAARGSVLSHRAIAYAEDNPGYVVQTAFWNTLRVFDVIHEDGLRRVLQYGTLEAVGVDRLLSPVVPASVYIVVALALAGIALEAAGRLGPRAPPFVWTFPVLMVLPAILVWGLARYRAPVDPFLIMLAALALTWLWGTGTFRPARSAVAARAARASGSSARRRPGRTSSPS